MLESTTNDDRRRAAATGRRLGRSAPLLACAALVMACPEPDEDDGMGVTGTTTGTSTASTGGPEDTGPDDTGPGTTSTDPTTPPDTGDTSDDESSGDTTGAPLSCGDGQVQPPEACDDGNEVDADGCNSDCTISGSILFEHSQASGLGDDRAFGVAVDGGGNAYVVGELLQANNDAWVRQYTPDDGLGFTVVDDSGSNDGARGVAVFGSQLYVAGHRAGNLRVTNYDDGGAQGWVVDYAGPGSGTDVAHAAAVDSTGSVIVGGSYRANYNNGVTITPHDNILVRKYTPAGAEAWAHNYGGPVNTGEDRVQGVAADSAGNVIAVGWETVGGVGREIWVRKFDPAGTPLWTMTHSGLDMDDDRAYAVATAPDDSIVVVGREITGGLSAMWMRKYDPDGMELWTQSWTGDTAEGAQGLGVAIDDAGDIAVTGLTVNATINEMFVHKYDAAGAMRWATPIPGIGGGASVGRAVTIAPDQRVWVAGERDLGVDGLDLYVARLAQ